MVSNKPYRDYADQTIKILIDRWFTESTPGKWIPADFWITPTICNVLVEYMDLTGKDTYIATLENARKASSEYWLTHCRYYDDLTVWGRFFMLAYNYLMKYSSPASAQDYLNDAITVYKQLHDAWDETCGGGITWMREGDFKATNSTLGYMETAINLYFATNKEPDYLDQAKKAWGWIVEKKLVDDIGMVWGSLDKESCQIDVKNPPVVALQGGPLWALWSMYQATNDTTYLDTAQKIIDAAITQMVWADDKILKCPDDALWNGQTNQWKIDHTGEAPFKGIFVRYLGDFTVNLLTVKDPDRQAAAKKYIQFLENNADKVWNNYPGHIFGMNWNSYMPNYQPIPKDDSKAPLEDELNATLQYSALALFVAAAKVDQASSGA